MKCKYCNGTGTSNTCVNGTFKPCTFCDGTGEYEPFDLDVELDKLYPTEQTEQEYIQTCNTEQLAEWIVRIVDCEFCPVKKPCKKQPCKKQIEKWLKQPHK